MIEETTFEVDGWRCTGCGRGFLNQRAAKNHARYCECELAAGGDTGTSGGAAPPERELEGGGS